MVRGLRRGRQESCSSSAATSLARRNSARSRKSCFRTRKKPQAARSRIASGLSFDDLAKERGLKPSDVDLGLIAKSAIIDPAIADAAFSLPSGEVSQPVQGKFGVALVKVGKIEPGVEPSYESVAAGSEEGDRDRARAHQRSPNCATRWKTSAAAAPA